MSEITRFIEWNRFIEMNPDFKLTPAPFSAREIFNFTCVKSLQDKCDSKNKVVDDETAKQICNSQLDTFLNKNNIPERSSWDIPRLFVNPKFLDMAQVTGRGLSKLFCPEVPDYTTEQLVEDFETGKLNEEENKSKRIGDSCNPFNLPGVASCTPDPTYVSLSEETIDKIADYTLAGSVSLIAGTLVLLLGPEVIPVLKKIWEASRIVDLAYFTLTRMGD